MINSVSVYDNKKNPFGTVSNHNSNTDYWIRASKPTETPTDEITINDVLTPQKAKKTHNLEAIGLSIAITTVAVTGLVLLLLKGGPKGLGKAIEKLRAKYIEKMQDAKLSGEKSSKKAEFILNKLNYFAQKGEAVNNVTTMKDYAFKRFMFALGNPTRRIHQGITNTFEKLGRRTVELAYGKTASRLLHTSELNVKLLNGINAQKLDEVITINGEALTRKEWLKKLKVLTKKVETTFEEHFGDTRRNMRLDKMHKNAKELEDSFNKQGDLWFLSKDTFKTFVAEQKMHANKMHIQIPIKTLRKEISNTPEDLIRESNEKITKISSMINFGEKDTINALNTLKKDLKTFASADGSITKDKIITDIDSLLKEYTKGINPTNINSRLSVIGEFHNLKMSVMDFKKGTVENILDIYKKLLPENEYNQIKKSYDKSLKSLDKSINLETEEFVNKLRDLTMGSAPTDILTNLVGVGTLAYYLGKSDDNQQRMGIALKYGFPALTLIGIGLYGNAKLFAGTKSLALGIVSSWIVNRIGTAADNMLMKHFEKKNIQAQQQTQPELKQT